MSSAICKCGYALALSKSISTGKCYKCRGEESKDQDPKQSIGVHKYSVTNVPACVVAELGVAMLEGALKYGPFNYRKTKVKATTYYGAADRHMRAWFEGENIDPDSGLNHIIKAIASLTILRDAMINDKLIDDRPPSAPIGWIDTLNEHAKLVRDKYENKSGNN